MSTQKNPKSVCSVWNSKLRTKSQLSHHCLHFFGLHINSSLFSKIKVPSPPNTDKGIYTETKVYARDISVGAFGAYIIMHEWKIWKTICIGEKKHKNADIFKNSLEFGEGIYVKSNWEKNFDKILYTFIINTFCKLGLKETFFFFTS